MTLRYPSLSAVPQRLLKPRARMLDEATVALSMAAECGPKRKYRNQPVMYDGKRFDSKLEWRCYEWLKLRRQARDVKYFIRQVPFELPGGVIYRADFLAVTKDRVEVIDAKGRDTQASRNKRKQVLELYGVDVMLWSDKA